MSDTKLREKADALIAFTQQGPRFIAWVQAVTDALAPAPEKVAKVCGNCGEKVSSLSDHVTCAETGDYYCQPAPPEPAATVDTTKTVAYCDELDARYGKPAAREMESARGAIAAAREYALELDHPESMEFHIRVDGFATGARYQRNLAQPVAVGMTEELEHVLSIAERDLRYKEECFDDSARTVPDERIERLRAAIAAVREQFGNGRKVECPNCGEMTERSHSRYEGPGPDKWACQPAPPEPAKVVCPNCGDPVRRERDHYSEGSEMDMPGFYCLRPQPAPPEPTAPIVVEPTDRPMDFNRSPFAPAAPVEISELDGRHMRMASPEAQAKFRADMDRRAIEIGMERLVGVANHPISETVTVGTWQLEELLKYADFAEVALRTGFHPPEFLFEPADRSLRQAIDAIKRQRDGWRTHAQPVAVGMTEELEHVLSIAERDLRYKEECFDDSARTVPDERIERLRAAIAAVREQAAQGRKVELGKVREWLRASNKPSLTAKEEAMLAAAFAELNAAEGKVAG